MRLDTLRTKIIATRAVVAALDAALPSLLLEYVEKRRGAGATYYAIGDELDLSASYLRKLVHDDRETAKLGEPYRAARR